MNQLLKLIKRAAKYRVAIGSGAVCLTIMAGYFFLSYKASDEEASRTSADALIFQKAPEAWLNNQANESEFRAALESKKLSKVALTRAPGMVLFTTKDGKKASVMVAGCTLLGCAGTVLEKLSDRAAVDKFSIVRVEVDIRTPAQRLLDLINLAMTPVITVVALIAGFFLMTKLQTGFGGAASKLSKRPDTRFADVIGNAEAKAALNRIKAFMLDPAEYVKLGARAPHGALLVGPPGVGKTLIAQALAGECKAAFIAVDGSYFTAMFYGAGVAKVKALFKLARANAPCVLFIDEMDGIGKRTQGGEASGGEAEGNRIINRILVEMDGFESMDGVCVLGATNHESNLDEALRRPGRLDMLVRLGLPTLPDRAALFDLYIGKVVNDGAADMSALARMTSGMSPADIANVVNKAASTAAENSARVVTSEHFLRAIETHQLGGEVSPIKGLLTDATRRRLAFHEAGHGLVAHLLNAGLVERITIEPRGAALGVTYITRETEDPLYDEAELSSRLAMMLGGREAELLVFGTVSSGASDDLKRASELAIKMVSSLGFSRSFGLLSVAGVPKELLGPDIQAAVLKEARTLLEEAQAKCKRLLTTHRSRLDAISARLLELEVLSGDELVELLGPREAVLALVA